MKMNKSGVQSRIPMIVVSFVAGWLVASIGWLVFMGFLRGASKPVRVHIRENKQASAFFYRTVHALFEGTYSSEDGSISEHALDVFRETALNIGNKCYLKIYDNESGYHGGIVFFPSGDIFHLTIMPHAGQGFVITDFNRMDWDYLWSSELKRTLPKPNNDTSNQ